MEYRSAPSVLVLADSDAAAARARSAAEAAGCRVAASAPIAAGVDRIDQQLVDAVLIELDEDPGTVLDRLLDRIAEDVVAGRYGGVVTAPPELIDAVAARSLDAGLHHLCAPSNGERIDAIAAAVVRSGAMLREGGPETPSLRQLSEEVGRIANLLAEMSVQKEGGAPGEAATPADARPIEVSAIRAMIRVRRLRDSFFHPALFADPAWDMILDLFASRLEYRAVAVSSLCIAAAVPPTTALRWIRALTEQGLFLRRPDPEDGRRIYIELSDPGAAAFERWYHALRQTVLPLI